MNGSPLSGSPFGRSTRERRYEVTPLELFFDLVFVFAVSQLSHHLLAHLSWRGVVETLVLLRAVYGAWYATSWVATMISANEARTRRMLLAVMLLGLFMNAAVTRAFTTSGWAFVVPLLLIQVGRTAWTVVNAGSPVIRDHFSRALTWFVAIAPLWLAGAAAAPNDRLRWWLAAAGIDLVGAWLAHPLPGRRLHTEDVELAGGHLLERCRLFLLIALGETVLTTGTAVADAPMTPMTVATGTAALVGTVALWVLAFGRAGDDILRFVDETRDPAAAGHRAVSALLVMVAGLIAVAVADEAVITHPYGDASALLSTLIYGGPILFLLALGWYLRAVLRVRPRQQMAGTATLLVVGIATLPAAPYLALILAGVSLGALALVDWR